MHSTTQDDAALAEAGPGRRGPGYRRNYEGVLVRTAPSAKAAERGGSSLAGVLWALLPLPLSEELCLLGRFETPLEAALVREQLLRAQGLPPSAAGASRNFGETEWARLRALGALIKSFLQTHCGLP